MSDFILDLTGYKSTQSDYIPEGRYTVVIDDIETDKSKAGNSMLVAYFRVSEGDHAGATLVDRYVYANADGATPKSLFRLVGLMQALNMPSPKKRLKLNLRMFAGRTLEVDVEDGDPYQGKVKSEVRGWIRVTGSSATTEGPDDLPDVEDITEPYVAAPAPEAPAPAAEPVAAPAPATEAPAPVAQPAAAAAAAAPAEAEDVDLSTLDLG